VYIAAFRLHYHFLFAIAVNYKIGLEKSNSILDDLYDYCLQISTLRTWIERVRTFYRIAKENGHRLVVKLKDCYYYYLKYTCRRTANAKLGVPNYDDKDIVIYNKPKQVSGTYADGDYFTART